jgi:rubrerythrin
MSNPKAQWFQLNKDQKRVEIRQRRLNGESFARIAFDLLGDSKNKSTIWSWAQRNMDTMEIYPKMMRLPSEPFTGFTDVEQWIMYDILSSLFPRLDAMSQHLLVEIRKIHTEQKEKFSTTAGFLDELETRIIESIRRNSVMLSSNVSRVVATATTPPPPPPSVGAKLPPQIRVESGTIAELRTDFEEMSMEEITGLPSDFLEALTPVDRNRLQERVKELKRIERMSPEERETYLQKKKEEKERSEAAEGLGASLTSMLDDSNSLFARMRQAADESQVIGTGTFGKFTTEFIYFYCFACGKMNRTEDIDLSSCEFCGAGEDQLVLDDEKSNYTYWECLSSKVQELVNLNYSRGTQIIVKSRWKARIGESFNPFNCKKEKIREITSAVLVKEDPDKQFSHYLALFRMYMQMKLKEDLETNFRDLYEEIQKFPDIISIEEANRQAVVLMEKISLLINWFETEGLPERDDNSKELQIQLNNLSQDLKLLKDPESPQELRKASEVGHITGKIDQILHRFVTIIIKLEPELLMTTRWQCSECNDTFEVKDRHKFPERCASCGKIITKLEIVD